MAEAGKLTACSSGWVVVVLVLGAQLEETLLDRQTQTYLTLSSSEATVSLRALIWASLCLSDSTR